VVYYSQANQLMIYKATVNLTNLSWLWNH